MSEHHLLANLMPMILQMTQAAWSSKGRRWFVFASAFTFWIVLLGWLSNVGARRSYEASTASWLAAQFSGHRYLYYVGDEQRDIRSLFSRTKLQLREYKKGASLDGAPVVWVGETKLVAPFVVLVEWGWATNATTGVQGKTFYIGIPVVWIPIRRVNTGNL